MDEHDLAELLYSTYCDAVGGKAYNGDTLPSWSEFIEDPEKEAWVEAAREAIDALS